MSTDTPTPDVFLSYASSNREVAAGVARALESTGLTVWWDRKITAGDVYPPVIEEALDAASCVVVLWSADSRASEWVSNEARRGKKRGKLIPVRIEDVDPPLEFDSRQAVDLVGWTGRGDHPGLERLVADVHARLERDAPATRPHTGAAPRRRAPAALALLAVIVAALVVWQLLDRGGPDAPPAEDLAFTPLTGDGRTRSSALSADGRTLAYTRTEDNRTTLLLKQIDTGAERVLVPADDRGLRSPTFSPDGDHVYFAVTGPPPDWRYTAPGDLMRVSTLGGPPQLVAENVLARRFDCSPDGARVAYKRHDGEETRLLVADADGSDERAIAAIPRNDRVHTVLAWTSDGTGVVTSHRDSLGALVLSAFPVAGGEPRRLPGDAWQVVVDLDAPLGGRELLVLGKPSTTDDLNINLWRLPDGGDGFHALTNDMTYYYQVSSDRTGADLALTFYAAKRTLKLIDPDDPGDPRDLSTDVVPNGQVVWAGADRLLVNQRIGNRVGLVYMGTGGGAQRLPADVDWIGDMAVSPDGGAIAYQTGSGSRHDVWLARADGGAPVRINAEGGDAITPGFTPGSDRLIYAHRDSMTAPYRIVERDLSAGETRRLCETEALSPLLSPDGRRIAARFTLPEGGHAFGTIPAGGGEPELLDLPRGLRLLCWTPGSDGFTCASREGDRIVVWTLPLDGRGPERVFEFVSEQTQVTDADWNPAGDTLAICLQSVAYDALLLERRRGE